jgi:ribonuclease HI
MAILEAIREASSRGWSNIIFESDSKVVVDAIKANFGLKQKVLI